ncbi:MAG: tRNA guanosine(34) transglycosylase Tgt [Candidatus Saccharibacteria bacterium]|nr:tRNA guanosine(34) transglycosylase Tgt [Candidatus Saccharibacteria bacterium]
MNNSKDGFFTSSMLGTYARRGTLKTRAGDIYTPVFMPVGTRGAVKGLSPQQVRETGAQIILGNAYHLHLQPGEKTVKKLGGLHEFTRWDGPILTDSGGFQVFSLAHITKTTEDGVSFKDPKSGDNVFLSPEKAIQIQLELGADIIMAFDDVTGLDDTARLRTKEAFDRTHRWLERSLAEFQRQTKDLKPGERPLLFGIAQGGLDKQLRQKSLEFVQSLPVDGIAIGGLSVGESRKDMHEMLEFLAPLYDKSRPHYLMGVGDPTDFRFAIECGIDMVDCVLATRNARHGTAWVHNGCTPASCQTAEPPAPKPVAVHRGVETPSTPSPYPKYGSVCASVSPSAVLACSRCGKVFGARDEKMHLTNAQFIDDNRPIEEGCDCATCAYGYSRGFLRHQFKVKESLAGSLVSIHNIRYLNRITETYLG